MALQEIIRDSVDDFTGKRRIGHDAGAGRALTDFGEDAKGADVALIFCSGHGIEIAGDNRLVPVDADASALDALKASTLPLEEVRDVVASTSKIGLVVLDACRDDRFGATTAGGRGAAALKPEIVDKVRLVA